MNTTLTHNITTRHNIKPGKGAEITHLYVH